MKPSVPSRILAWAAIPVAVVLVTVAGKGIGAPATTTDTVRVHVGSLRRKIEPDPAHPRYIGTEPWVGYRFLVEME